MKNNQKNLILFIMLLFLTNLVGCSDDEDSSTGTSLIESGEVTSGIILDEAEGDSVNPPESTVIYSRKDFLKKFRVSDPIYLRPLEERVDALISDKDYHFDVLTGKCFDSTVSEQRGDSHSLECNIPESVESRNDDFAQYNFFGADARDISVSDASVSMHDLVFAEVKFNHQSILNSEKKPFYKLFQNQKRVYFGQKNYEKKYAKSLKKYQDKRRSLKSKFRKAKNDKQRVKIKAKVESLNTRIKLVKLNHKISRKKSKRHLKELKWISKSEELNELKDKFSRKNKKSTFFDGATAFTYLPSNEVFDTESFSISLWFRTDLDQEDKRLFNLHRGESAGSALNLSLKRGRIVMGIHNGSEYISNEYDHAYDDNLWHNFVVTKNKKGFTVYVDGHKAIEYKGDFSGFGSHPLVFGSYNGKGYYYSGEIDEISLWSKGLSRSDVKKIFNSGVATNIKLHPSSLFLKKWWRMGDNKKDTENELYESMSKTYSSIVQ